MKNDSKKTSRRDFTKSVTTALVSVPFLSSMAEGRAPDNPKKTKLAFPCEEVMRTDHIPPPDLYGGSFHIELSHTLSKRTGQHGPSARPERRFADVPSDAEQYGTIAYIMILTDFRECLSYYSYEFPSTYDPQLRLWLQEVSGSDEFAFDPLTTEPQIIIQGNIPDGGRLTLMMESRKALGSRKATHKKDRPHKYEHPHPGSGGVKDFRIGQWQITDSNGIQIMDFFDNAGTSKANNYRFMIYCNDPTERSRKRKR